MVTIDPKDLIGRTSSELDNVTVLGRFIQAVIEKEDQLKKGSEYMKCICEAPGSTVDDIFIYDEILDHIKNLRVTQSNCSSFHVSLHTRDLFIPLGNTGKARNTMC
jgi:hypothetical protein